MNSIASSYLSEDSFDEWLHINHLSRKQFAHLHHISESQLSRMLSEGTLVQNCLSRTIPSVLHVTISIEDYAALSQIALHEACSVNELIARRIRKME